MVLITIEHGILHERMNNECLNAALINRHIDIDKAGYHPTISISKDLSISYTCAIFKVKVKVFISDIKDCSSQR